MALAFPKSGRQTEGMIELTEPQTWATIGVLGAALLGTITVVTNVLMRTITVKIGSTRNEIGSLRNEIHSEIAGLRAEINARFETVEARFQTMDVRFDSLDRDVQAVATRVFGTDRP